MSMIIRSQRLLFTALVLHLAASFVLADAVLVNGVCELHACTASETLAPGASVRDTFSFTYMFANSDRYAGSGTIEAINNENINGLYIVSAADIRLTYLGNASGTSSGADTLTIDFLQYFQSSVTRSFVNNSGFESIAGSFGGPIANASSVQGQAFTNTGTAMRLLGPFSPPHIFFDSADSERVSGGPVSLLDFRDTLTFGAGSEEGAEIYVTNTPTPEPSTLCSIGMGFLGWAAMAWRRKIGCVGSCDR